MDGRIDTSKAVLKLPFVSDKVCRRVRNHVRTSGLDHEFNVIFKHGPNIMASINDPADSSWINKCARNCSVCLSLPKHYSCTDKNVVYCYTCNICGGTYIGYTARSIKTRHNEHTRSINKADNISALSSHICTQHNSLATQLNMDNYKLTILQRCSDSVNACLAESLYIQRHKPTINRKHEGCAQTI